MPPKYRILVINPNSTKAMTDTLKPILDEIAFPNIDYELFTAPSGPKSINNEVDAAESERHSLPALEEIAGQYDGFLVACFSAHPLVPTLKAKYPEKHVLGIFEASVVASTTLCWQSGQGEGIPEFTWGIVTTGKAWEPLLKEATETLLQLRNPQQHQQEEVMVKKGGRFAGVHSTGMDADELHDAPKDLVRERLTQATQRLLNARNEREELKAVVLGCAGMSELEAIVKEVVPPGVEVIDGVKTGYSSLAGMIVSDIKNQM